MVLKLEIAEILDDLFPLGYHIYCPICLKTAKPTVIKINGKWLAKAVYLKKVPENYCFISLSLSSYLDCNEIVDIETVEDNFLALERVSLEVISPIDIDLKRYDCANFLLAGEIIAVGCEFEFEYLDNMVKAKVKDADCPFGVIAVNTKLEFTNRPFYESYCRPEM